MRRRVVLAWAGLGLAQAASLGGSQLQRQPQPEPARSRLGSQSDQADARVSAPDISGGQWSGDHYSALNQINGTTVKKLSLAWTFDTGEASTGMQTNPLFVDGVVYAYTSSQQVIALDAEKGTLRWKFDSGVTGQQPVRGVSFWTDGHRRFILAGVMNFLYELNAETGRPVQEFGEGGRIDLRKGLGGDFNTQSIALTSPGIIYKDLIIVGGREPEAPPAPPGNIRAFNVRTGALAWEFRTIPHPGDPGYASWPPNAWKSAGAANNWAGMAIDERRGVVYVPTGSAVPDFYGGARVGDDLWSNCLLALNAATGKLLWSFQGVHHDIWDRDFPAAPALLTVERNGRRVDAVAQTTKQGFVFLFDRDTGKPLFPVEERSVPGSTVPGEISAATQPFPTLPAPYSRQSLSMGELTNRTPRAHEDAVALFKTFIGGGQFHPLSVGTQTVVVPGFDGGGEWGGPGVDRLRGVIYINANDVVDTGGLYLNEPDAGSGLATYRTQCAACHRDDRAGSPPAFPSLLGLEKRLTPEQIIATIHAGKGRMPAFPSVQGKQLIALLEYVRTGVDTSTTTSGANGEERESAEVAVMNRYRFSGYKNFRDSEGFPAVAPPWGTLNAIDLNTGKYLWKVPLGSYPDAGKAMEHSGSENYGGPVVTGGGLVIIGATVFDKKLHIFDSQTGALLWEYELPYPAVATPTTYMVDGRQFIVIACGGSKLTHGSARGLYVAFALPEVLARR